MDELFAVLFSWAVTLSGLPAPAEAPDVVRVPHSFFVENACGGQECKVYGWYAGGRKVYVDERMDPKENLLGASIVVHEMVHYLQYDSHHYRVAVHGATYGERPGCTDAIDMEREAYGVQREFLLRYGVYQPVGVSMLRVGCEHQGRTVRPAGGQAEYNEVWNGND